MNSSTVRCRSEGWGGGSLTSRLQPLPRHAGAGGREATCPSLPALGHVRPSPRSLVCPPMAISPPLSLALIASYGAVVHEVEWSRVESTWGCLASLTDRGGNMVVVLYLARQSRRRGSNQCLDSERGCSVLRPPRLGPVVASSDARHATRTRSRCIHLGLR